MAKNNCPVKPNVFFALVGFIFVLLLIIFFSVTNGEKEVFNTGNNEESIKTSSDLQKAADNLDTADFSELDQELKTLDKQNLGF